MYFFLRKRYNLYKLINEIKECHFSWVGVNYILFLDKEKVKELYLSGYTTKEISKIVNAKEDAVRKCINRNFKLLREKHFYAKAVRKEALKAISYEAKKGISDKPFIESNKSIYKMRKNGDIVIDRAVAPVTTWDTPTRLSKEKDLTKNC